MSLHSFRTAMGLRKADHPFCSLIMAAMAKADSDNLPKLQEAWPGIWRELDVRYNAPGGLTPSERERAAEGA